MSEKKRGKARKIDEDSKPTKEEYAVAKFLRFGLPVREGKMHGMDVKCFIANAAVDKLLASKWSAAKCKKDPLFTNRASVVMYLDVLLMKGLFHRAERDRTKRDKDKVKKKKREKDAKKDKEEGSQEEELLRERKGKKDKKAKKVKGETDTEKTGEDTDKKDTADKKPEKEKKDEKKKKEKKLKLLMSDDQWFEDGDEVFVWIYDPVNAKNFLIGLLMVLGVIGLCMFPLWPEEVRIGVSYISQALGAFLVLILSLCVVRLILFFVIWLLTLGRHHFWLFPNLMEDVGFFDSFKPFYKHDRITGTKTSNSEEKKSKKKSSADTGSKTPVIESSETKEKSSDKDDSDEFEVIKKEDLDENRQGQEDDDDNIDDNEGDTENGVEEDFDEEEEDEDDEEDDDMNSEKDEDSSENKQKKGEKKTN